MFDPEKVDRFSYEELGISQYVSASDYDQLLELYRKLLADFNKDPKFDFEYEPEGPLGGKLKFLAKPPRTS